MQGVFWLESKNFFYKDCSLQGQVSGSRPALHLKKNSILSPRPTKVLNPHISGSDFQAALSFLSLSQNFQNTQKKQRIDTKNKQSLKYFVLFSEVFLFVNRSFTDELWSSLVLIINLFPLYVKTIKVRCSLLKIQIQKVTTSGVCPPYLGLMGKGDHFFTIGVVAHVILV